MRHTLWMALISTCLLGVAVDSVVIRPFRDKDPKASAKYSAGSNQPLDQLSGSGSPYPYGGWKGSEGRRPGTGKKAFRPTTRSCCKMGYKLAKKQVDCSVRVLEVVRKLGDRQRAKMKYAYGSGWPPANNGAGAATATKAPPITARMSTKIGKCSASFPRDLEKCCKYREQFYKSVDKCKDRPRHERRQCRRSVRKLYRMSSLKDKSESDEGQTGALDLAGKSRPSDSGSGKQRRPGHPQT